MIIIVQSIFVSLEQIKILFTKKKIIPGDYITESYFKYIHIHCEMSMVL